MKIVKTASGKQKITISKSEWQDIGQKSGWMKTAGERPGGKLADRSIEPVYHAAISLQQQIHAIINPEAKGVINGIIARPLSELIVKVQEFKQQGIGFVQR